MPEISDAALTSALIIRPGDVLVIALDGRLSMEHAERIRGFLTARMPGLADVVLIEAKALAVYRPDGEPADG